MESVVVTKIQRIIHSASTSSTESLREGQLNVPDYKIIKLYQQACPNNNRKEPNYYYKQ